MLAHFPGFAMRITLSAASVLLFCSHVFGEDLLVREKQDPKLIRLSLEMSCKLQASTGMSRRGMFPENEFYLIEFELLELSMRAEMWRHRCEDFEQASKDIAKQRDQFLELWRKKSNSTRKEYEAYTRSREAGEKMLEKFENFLTEVPDSVLSAAIKTATAKLEELIVSDETERLSN